MKTNSEIRVYGVVAEFNSAEDILKAAKRAVEYGFQKMEAYTPFPVHGLDETIRKEDHRIKWIIFLCGFLGAIVGISMQYWVSVVAYPLNSGGRPLFSWPSFVPVTFECTILFSAFGAVIGMLALNGLPRLHHPIFNASNFFKASQDKFFLCIESKDANFQSEKVKSFFESLSPLSIEEIYEEAGGH